MASTTTTTIAMTMTLHRMDIVNDRPHEDRWGHIFEPKATGYIQFLAQNIGGINLTSSGSIKLVALWEFTTHTSVDMVAIMECNAAWDNIKAQLHPAELGVQSTGKL